MHLSSQGNFTKGTLRLFYQKILKDKLILSRRIKTTLPLFYVTNFNEFTGMSNIFWIQRFLQGIIMCFVILVRYRERFKGDENML